MASSAAPQNRYRQPRRATLDLNPPPIGHTRDGRIEPDAHSHHLRHLEGWARRLVDGLDAETYGDLYIDDPAAVSSMDGGQSASMLVSPPGPGIWVLAVEVDHDTTLADMVIVEVGNGLTVSKETQVFAPSTTAQSLIFTTLLPWAANSVGPIIVAARIIDPADGTLYTTFSGAARCALYGYPLGG